MRALLSVSDKAGLTDFARGLIALDCELISTGGTAKALAAADLPVTPVSDVTGFPEMLDGRIKTLHPKIHGGILARRKMPEDMTAIAAQGIAPIDLVVVNLYPFEETAKRPDATFEELIENIDIGGPSMIRAAAKNFQDVLVVVDPGGLSAGARRARARGRADPRLRRALCSVPSLTRRTTIRLIASRRWTPTGSPQDGGQPRVPGRRRSPVRRKSPSAAASAQPPRSLWQCTRVRSSRSRTSSISTRPHGSLVEFTEPAAAVIKHTNPCGVATVRDDARPTSARARQIRCRPSAGLWA